MKDAPELSPRAAFVLALVLSLLLGVVDWASGYELQFFIFYFIPITLAGWNCGLARTLGVSALCGGLWISIDIYSGHPYSSWLYASWSALIRIGSFLLNGYSVARIKNLVLAERQSAAELRHSAAEVKALKGLLPICAGCQRVRDDKGYWLQVEEYLRQHPDALQQHDGYCNTCEAKMLRDAGIEVPSGAADRGAV